MVGIFGPAQFVEDLAGLGQLIVVLATRGQSELQFTDQFAFREFSQGLAINSLGHDRFSLSSLAVAQVQLAPVSQVVLGSRLKKNLQLSFGEREFFQQVTAFTDSEQGRGAVSILGMIGHQSLQLGSGCRILLQLCQRDAQQQSDRGDPRIFGGSLEELAEMFDGQCPAFLLVVSESQLVLVVGGQLGRRLQHDGRNCPWSTQEGCQEQHAQQNVAHGRNTQRSPQVSPSTGSIPVLSSLRAAPHPYGSRR